MSVEDRAMRKLEAEERRDRERRRGADALVARMQEEAAADRAKPFLYSSPFGLGVRVNIDGALDVVATVTAISWREALPQIEVSWFNNGSLMSAWVAPSRLSPVAP